MIGATLVTANDNLHSVDVSNRLYSINITTQQQRQLCLSVAPGETLANGVAVDHSRFNLLVMDGNNYLLIWRDGSDTLDIAATPERIGLDDNCFTSVKTNALSADHFDDAYWFPLETPMFSIGSIWMKMVRSFPGSPISSGEFLMEMVANCLGILPLTPWMAASTQPL